MTVIAKNESPVIGVVGVCGSGKSTLIAGLKPLGINGRHIVQEHSYVQTMWLRIVHPDLLIFLDASYAATVHRRNLNWTEEEYQEQHRRLANARQHADLYIFTDPLTSAQVIQAVLEFLKTRGLQV
jgi:ABC-type glutathione transport system ATPase component